MAVMNAVRGELLGGSSFVHKLGSRDGLYRESAPHVSLTNFLRSPLAAACFASADLMRVQSVGLSRSSLNCSAAVLMALQPRTSSAHSRQVAACTSKAAHSPAEPSWKMRCRSLQLMFILRSSFPGPRGGSG